MRWFGISWAWVCLLVTGCVGGYPPGLTSPDPAARIRAIRQIAEKGQSSAVPLLVNRLEDEDEAVRFYAIGALVRLTGSDQGYKYYAPERERTEAVKRWRNSVRNRGKGEPTAASVQVRP